jgi:magnesium transporter
MAEILTEMPADDRVDLLKDMSRETREAILPALAQAEREDIRRLFAHREGTAGSVMTSEYATVRADRTAAEATPACVSKLPTKKPSTSPSWSMKTGDCSASSR